MKKVLFLAVTLVFAGVFAAPALAQGNTAAAGGAKMGWIDTRFFGDEKEGIKRLTAAYTALEREAQPKEQELVGIQNRLQTIATEIDNFRKAAAAPNAPPINAKTITDKQDEAARLQREGEFKKKEYDAFIEKRSNELLGPINQDIVRQISEFAKQKGYSVVFDISKMAEAGAILHLDPTADITKEFITFYNARPATAQR
ncbi:MAG: OmpH family outer membrane protein [Acidobacteria bacterium]|nr:OmpH family outer membrane protein [Acidobacteriota bacterium]